MSKQAIISVLVLVVFGGAGFLIWKSREPAQPTEPVFVAPTVEIVVAKAESLSLPIQTQGTVVARAESEITPEVAGRVEWMAPDFVAGGSFKPSEVLLRIDSRDYELGVEQARSRVAQAELRLSQIKAEAEQARAEWAAYSDQPPPPLAVRIPQIEEAESTAAAARADLERTQLAQSKTSVRAPPYSGRVLGVMTGLGQVVAPGRPIAKVFNIDSLEVRLPLTDPQVGLIGLPPPGRPIETPPEVELSTLVGGKQQVWKARMTRTEAALDPRTRVVFGIAEMPDDAAESMGFGLSVGQFVQATVTGTPRADIYSLPRSALRGDDQVMIVDAQSKLRFRQVGVVNKSGERVVVSSGLDDGDKVVVSPIEFPVDGMAVTIRKPS